MKAKKLKEILALLPEKLGSGNMGSFNKIEKAMKILDNEYDKGDDVFRVSMVFLKLLSMFVDQQDKIIEFLENVDINIKE